MAGRIRTRCRRALGAARLVAPRLPQYRGALPAFRRGALRGAPAAGRDRAFGFGPRGLPAPRLAEARSVPGVPAFLPPFRVPPFCSDGDAGLLDALKVRERRTKRRGAPSVGAAARGPAARLRAAGGRAGGVGAGRPALAAGRGGRRDAAGSPACLRCAAFCAGGSFDPGRKARRLGAVVGSAVRVERPALP